MFWLSECFYFHLSIAFKKCGIFFMFRTKNGDYIVHHCCELVSVDDVYCMLFENVLTKQTFKNLRQSATPQQFCGYGYCAVIVIVIASFGSRSTYNDRECIKWTHFIAHYSSRQPAFLLVSTLSHHIQLTFFFCVNEWIYGFYFSFWFFHRDKN